MINTDRHPQLVLLHGLACVISNAWGSFGFETPGKYDTVDIRLQRYDATATAEVEDNKHHVSPLAPDLIRFNIDIVLSELGPLCVKRAPLR
jgi:hypothetical protein